MLNLTPGIIVYQLLYGNYPFFALSLPELFIQIKKRQGKKLKFKKGVAVSEVMKGLIRSLLQMDPQNRISWDDFFNHEIFAPERGRNTSSYASSSKKSLGSNGRSRKPLYTESDDFKLVNDSTSLERKIKSSQSKNIKYNVVSHGIGSRFLTMVCLIKSG